MYLLIQLDGADKQLHTDMERLKGENEALCKKVTDLELKLEQSNSFSEELVRNVYNFLSLRTSLIVRSYLLSPTCEM